MNTYNEIIKNKIAKFIKSKKKKIDYRKPITDELDSLEYLEFFSYLKDSGMNYSSSKISKKTSINELIKMLKIKNK